MNNEKLIRYFGFPNELIIELADPAVRQAYLKWCAAVDAQNALPLLEPDETGADPRYDAFLTVARLHRAVHPLV